MSTRLLARLLIGSLLPLALACGGSSSNRSAQDSLDPGPAPELAFAGSESCEDAACHASEYLDWTASGHPYKLTKIEGEAPTSSFPAFSAFPNQPVDPPDGLTWGDISYVIGGYGWKMRWIDNNGYIVTSGAAETDVQFNFEDSTWTTYHSENERGTKPYNCGKCHTTGWVDEESDVEGGGEPDLSDNQDGLPGMAGTFLAPGVHCEQCHGLGSQHVADAARFPMVVDDSPELCGDCHTRDSERRIAAKGGFIRHHEQYDEWLHSPHAAGQGAPGCNDCHDPHASVKYDREARGQGVIRQCAECHAEQDATNRHPVAIACEDCHMPKAAKSAIKINEHRGDLRTHILTIETNPVPKEVGMFTEDGKFARLQRGSQASITLDFACYGCHRDVAGVGGEGSVLNLEALSALAEGIHD